MKIFSRLALIISILLLACTGAMAFQFADATAPRPAQPAKYIFYWGQQQSDLTAEQQYKGRLSMTPAAFRQMLLSAPKLWDGTGLIADFSFDLQQFKVNNKEYFAQIAELDRQFGQPASAGQVFVLTGLLLGNGSTAQIDIELTKPEKEKPPLFGLQGYAPFLNARLMETIAWGQEDKFEISDRDFFTVSEFWQIFGQEPYLEWRSWQEAQPVFAELQIIDAEEVTLSLRFYLEQQPYSDFIRQVRIYQHLIKPGIRATLLLQTSNQYERIYQKSLQLVGDQDERLRLRRNKDFHTLTFIWREWGEMIESLYLQQLADQAGNMQAVDQPVLRRSLATFDIDSLDYWAAESPVFSIDNEPVTGVSFTIHVGNSLSYRVDNGKFDAARFLQVFPTDSLKRNGLRISDIELPGYGASSIQFSIQKNFFSRNSLLQQNKLDKLQLTSTTLPGYAIKKPVQDVKNWKFDLELPRQTDLLISIFNSEGLNNYFEDFIAPSGSSSHNIPQNTITEKGKYTAFLISVFGVTKVEFEVP